MGCSYDIFNATFATKRDTEIFSKLFNEMLIDDLYDDEEALLDEESFFYEGDVWELGIDQEPLFCTMENGAQLEPVVHSFIEAVPEEDFDAMYECTFNNCGAIVRTYYQYDSETKRLKIRTLSSEDCAIYYCPECEYEFDDDGFTEEWTLDDWEMQEGEPFICPECGKVIEWDVWDYREIWKLDENGKLQKIKDNVNNEAG